MKISLSAMPKLMLLLLFVPLLSEATARAQIPEAEIDNLFASYTEDTPGMAVAIVKNGEILFRKGYGLANLEYDIPITAQTVFNVGSVSKQFTAFAIYLLAEQGKLSLDDDIRHYLPEMPDFGKPITIKHLCYHTSGLKEPLALLSFAGWRMDDYISMAQVIQLLSRQTSLNFETGTAFRYSNANYVLLAEIVARVSGESFADFTRKNIFEPLGMQQSQFYDDNERLIKNRAYSYDFEDGEFKKEKLNAAYVGSTALYTTAEDLAKWNANFYDPKVGSQGLLEKFNALATLDDGTPALLSAELNIQHAKGQFYRHYRGIETYIHTGGDAFFRSFFGRFPGEDLSIIVLSNSPHFVAFPTGIKLLEILVGDKMPPVPEDAPATPALPAQSSDPVAKPELTQYQGRFFSNELNSTFDVTLQEKQLWLRHFRLQPIPLQPLPDKAGFSGRNYYPFSLYFHKDKQGEVQQMEVQDFRGEKLIFEKL
ncbi:serine hydrolase domain-containing protein [Bowmanella dokdonensis]|uniref:Beta-lactamase family protein n=1 Tax=Bowmanella dokdonensis TaxID=751969 RepID=A0A939DM41_9ALTE|nr:serine hydrolase domain-containing protein [Bowmanella dokdonensis]MBN7824650.1 beta-lactamase family protein [Bowmanella dokdonensis]